MVTNDGMTGYTSNSIAVFVRWQFCASQTDALEYPDIITDDTGFPYYGTRSMVYRKMMSYFCSWMDINARFRMCLFRDDTRDIRHFQEIELVGNPIITYCPEARITKYYFTYVLGGGIAIKSRLRICCQQFTQLRKMGDEPFGQRGSHVWTRILLLGGKANARLNLFGEEFMQSLHHDSGMKLDGLPINFLIAIITWEKDGTAKVNYLF